MLQSSKKEERYNLGTEPQCTLSVVPHCVCEVSALAVIHVVLVVGVPLREPVRAANQRGPQPPMVQEDERVSRKRRDLHRYDVDCVLTQC